MLQCTYLYWPVARVAYHDAFPSLPREKIEPQAAQPFHGSFWLQCLIVEAKQLYTETLLHTNSAHRDAFTPAVTHRAFDTHKRFYTQTLLHTDPFTRRPFYTWKFVYIDPFTQKVIDRETLLHTDAFTSWHLHTETLYTQTLLMPRLCSIAVRHRWSQTALQLPFRSPKATKLHWNQNVALLQPWYKKLQKMNLNTVPKMGPPGGPIFGTACTA